MIEDKRIYFEESTRDLLKRLDEMQLDKISRIRAKNFTRAIRDAMTKTYVQTQTFNIFPHQCDLNYPSLGFCRVSSLAFINLMSEHNILNDEWDLYAVSNESLYHHFLKHRPDNIVFDLTFDQFTVDGITVPYDIAHKTDIGLLNDQDPLISFYNASGFDGFKPLVLPPLKDRY